MSPVLKLHACAAASGTPEALVAASVAALTLYDMAKAIDREMVVGEILLLEKHGGRSGSWVRTR